MTAIGSGDSVSHRVAVLSDIHGNVVALRAVLADIEALGIGWIVVAGDMVGFGPNPDEVVDLLAARGAQMIRGNHEKDYVALYATPQMPALWRTDPRLRSMAWSMERLGPQRRAFLSALPDRLLLDEATLVVHGSPRHVRDAILASTAEDDLEAMFAGESARLSFVGHTHRPLVRATARRRVVNVGAVGLPLDGDPRASYAVAVRPRDGQPGAWMVGMRRVAFDIDMAIAAYGSGLHEVDPGFAAIMARQLRTARNYYGPWLRVSADLVDDELPAAVQRYLDLAASGRPPRQIAAEELRQIIPS